MKTSKLSLTLACAAMISACGGGGGGGGGTPTPSPVPTPTPTVTPTPTGTCSLSARQDWTLAQLQEWYLFPNLLDTTVNKAQYTTVQDYIDALVAPARAQSRDRYFTYITSIAEEEAYYNSGETAGFGIRLGYDTPNRRVFVIEAFEGGPALQLGIDRGTEILAVGTSEATLQTVNSLMATGGAYAVFDALGPDTPGTTRVLRIVDASGVTRTVSVTKRDFELDPVSDRYGYKIIDDNGKKVGYINLRTFINTATDDLDEAFAAFKAAGVTELIIDLRYNGGGLVSVAQFFGSLMGKSETGKVFSKLTFRDSKSAENDTYTFMPRTASIDPTKIAFIGTGSTASASEMLINGMKPYIPATDLALIGTNTYGKPVGQIAIDRSACDDRLRVLAFKVVNAAGEGDYYTGLAGTIPKTCRAQDDISKQLGDPTEGMIATALNFLAGRSCTAITATTTQSLSDREPLMPRRPDTIQREVPGIS